MERDKLKTIVEGIDIRPNNLPISEIDAETVKRWHQKLVGIGEDEMKADIKAMSEASRQYELIKDWK